MKLYIVPTPIGNLEDITLRALRILKSVDFVLCEDTRTTNNLLKHFEIQQRCVPYHIHNEHKQLSQIIRQIQNSSSVALVSDAGTPGISDPGFLLIREAIMQGIEIESLPGATAFVPALVNSGLPTDSFHFFGFIPHKKGKETLLKKMAELECTAIFYESPHRLLKTLEMMATIIGGDRQITISRELTKIHEENFRGTITQAIERFKEGVKGEIVICLGAARG
ncbi:16S rRNA (cytidine(1402)-2'-O)-methyltransferase [Bacteroidales bacterium OttesenSCG-928-B11]|nr:16S rRNA (cytidine(1402)-2'-O)-methyltransferase [Bacteroidales bacterium OttesenSCG-928-E04]MDL2313320.1 16S rRNA (cytidine(1402)-2'-O)-methyltransferase [Bacteroidales bacterium OttesenSCG-928-B11]MDL2326629.1 16S rRNA (cytidine(1402)-2'-O)-methyltransferase [Bacteroidales bacterium OttesenSCG-928-A14]